MVKFSFSKIAIVAGDGELAEQVCAHFRSQRIYLPIFEAPLKRFVEYGVFTNDCLRIANAIRLLRSKAILLLGCEKDVIIELKQLLPQSNLLEFNSFDERALSKIPGFKAAGSQKIVDFSPEDDIPIGHIIAVEDVDSLSKVICRNLATAFDGYIVIIPKATREDADIAHDYLRMWASGSHDLDRNNAKNALLSLVKRRLSKLTSVRVKSISFITKGIPYGIHPFNCPTTHYFHFPLLGLNIIKGMMKSFFSYLRCTAAYLVDPKELPVSELEDLRKILLSRGFIVRESFDRNAKVREVDYSTQFLPLDFIFYSTHCGEVNGKRIKEKFLTSDSEEHIVIYDQATSFAPEPGADMVEVLNLVRWVSLDGVDWHDNKGKDRINAGDIINQYIEKRRKSKTGNDDRTIIETFDIGKVKYSDALKMSDFSFIPMPTDLGNHRYPIVFNNACSSWRELAIRFANAGASIYIGTSTDIPNAVAIDIVTKYTRLLATGRSLGYSLFNAQKSYISQLEYTPYLMHGNLFTKCVSIGSREKNARYFFKELTRAIRNWDKKTATAQSQEIKTNSKKVVTFLKKEKEDFLKYL